MMYHCIAIDLQSPSDAKLFQDVRHAELHKLVNLDEERDRDLQFGTMAKYKVRSWGVWQIMWTDNMLSRLEACS